MAVNFSKPIENNEEEENVDSRSLFTKLNDYVLSMSKVPLKERLFFVQHLSLMLKSGISLSVGIKTLADQTEHQYFVKVLRDIGSSVEKGTSFAESLKPHSKIFGEMFIAMVEAGELSGKLEEVLKELFIQMKKSHALRSKVKGALTYPAVIVIAMLGIGTFMMIFVVPKITDMFADLDAELPLPTKILIGISDALVNNGMATVIILSILIFLIVKVLKTKKGKFIFQGILLKTPIFGPIIKKINIASFARNISSLLKTDIMIIKTFEITANVLGNLHYRDLLLEMAEKIKKGGKLHEVIKVNPKLFPPVVTQMVAIGEETGELDNILTELAEFYEEEIDQIMENLPAIIEPVLILVLGLGVGGVAVSIIMPMYSITTAI
jgi:type IV pilus assembly protein PilC